MSYWVPCPDPHALIAAVHQVIDDGRARTWMVPRGGRVLAVSPPGDP